MISRRPPLVAMVLLLGCSPSTSGEVEARGAAIEATKETATPAAVEAPAPPAVAAGAPASLDFAKFSAEAGAKMDRVMDRPKVDDAVAKMWDDIGDDPQVSAAGAELLGRLATDPGLSQATGAFMSELPNSPEFMAVIREIAAAHPGADEAELQAYVARHVDEMGDRPEFDAALDVCLDRFLERPRLQEGIDTLTDVLMSTGSFKEEVGAAFVRKFGEPGIQATIQAKVGVDPTAAGYEQALVDYISEEDRLEAFVIGFFELFARHGAPRKAVAELLGSDALSAASIDAARRIMEDASFKERAKAALVALVSGADQARLEREIDAMLATPVVEESFSSWFEVVAKSPQLEQSIGTALRDVARDPEFDALITSSFL